MSGSAELQSDPEPITACTVSRDVQNFDLLIEDMEAELGEAGAIFRLTTLSRSLNSQMPRTSSSSPWRLTIRTRRTSAPWPRSSRPLSSETSKSSLSPKKSARLRCTNCLNWGAEEFVPYPLPDGALHDAIKRMREKEVAPVAHAAPQEHAPRKSTGNREAVILAVQPMAGGTGATTFAVNLAWELTQVEKTAPPRVCLLDFGLQFGSTATYLDLPRRDVVYELLTDTEMMDQEIFMQALLTYEDRLHVLTAPPDILPLDMITVEDVGRIVEMARTNFDYVIIDMPNTLVQWTETVLQAAHVYFVTLELDLRSAQNTLRMIKALKAEELPVEKLRYVLNRSPKFTDLSGKSRVKRLAESLDISIELMLPDGGKQVPESGDHGAPLANSAPKNVLRKELQKLAKSVHDLNQADIAAQ